MAGGTTLVLLTYLLHALVPHCHAASTTTSSSATDTANDAVIPQVENIGDLALAGSPDAGHSTAQPTSADLSRLIPFVQSAAALAGANADAEPSGDTPTATEADNVQATTLNTAETAVSNAGPTTLTDQGTPMADRPALTNAEGQAPTTAEGPAPTTAEDPAPTTAEDPAPTTAEDPAPTTAEGPAATGAEVLPIQSSTASNIFYLPDFWSAPSPSVMCEPPCNIVLPPYTLSTPTTFSFGPLTTVLTEKWSHGSETLTRTSSTVFSFEPMTTSVIPWFNLNITSEGGPYSLTPSVFPIATGTMLPPPELSSESAMVFSITSFPPPPEATSSSTAAPVPFPLIEGVPPSIGLDIGPPPAIGICQNDCIGGGLGGGLGIPCLAFCNSCGLSCGVGGSSGGAGSSQCVGSGCHTPGGPPGGSSSGSSGGSSGGPPGVGPPAGPPGGSSSESSGGSSDGPPDGPPGGGSEGGSDEDSPPPDQQPPQPGPDPTGNPNPEPTAGPDPEPSSEPTSTEETTTTTSSSSSSSCEHTITVSDCQITCTDTATSGMIASQTSCFTGGCESRITGCSGEVTGTTTTTRTTTSADACPYRPPPTPWYTASDQPIPSMPSYDELVVIWGGMGDSDAEAGTAPGDTATGPVTATSAPPIDIPKLLSIISDPAFTSTPEPTTTTEAPPDPVETAAAEEPPVEEPPAEEPPAEEQPPASEPVLGPGGVDMSTPDCVACAEMLNSDSCGDLNPSNCRIVKCKHNTHCIACGIKCEKALIPQFSLPGSDP